MKSVFGLSVLGLAVVSSVAVAQQPQVQPQVRPSVVQQQLGAGQPHPGAHQHQTSDQQIAAVIAICNRNEVEAAKFALPKLKSDEAKEIATMLIKDHTEAANKFSKWAGQAANVNTGVRGGAETREEGREERREEGRREERREERRDDDQSKAIKPAQQNPAIAANQQPRVALKPAASGLDWVALHQEIADEGLASCKKELSRYEGNEFDKAFLGHQIGGHLMAQANLKVLKRHASSQLGSEIDEALAGTESHLKKIRDLMEEKKDEKNK
jgi:predicted outer membrane protein